MVSFRLQVTIGGQLLLPYIWGLSQDFVGPYDDHHVQSQCAHCFFSLNWQAPSWAMHDALWQHIETKLLTTAALPQVRGIQLTSWADVVRATPIDTSLTPFRPFEQCCSLKPGNDMVDFEHDCAWENVMKPNFTARAEVLEPRSVNLTSTTMSAPRRMQKLRGLIVRNVNEVN